MSDIAAYRVYYGTSPGSLSQSATVTGGAGVTSQVITGLTAGTLYFAVSTINSTGAESARSNPASKTVP